MIVVAISDLHNKFPDKLPEADILIVAGDFSVWGKIQEVRAFADWLRRQPARHKIVVPGNHDFYLEREPYAAQQMLAPATVLVDRLITIHGVTIYGAPWTPIFHQYAFMRNPEEMARAWAGIPEGLDILVTHGPAYGILDCIPNLPEGEQNVGCPQLLAALQTLENPPKYHIFGHIHEGYGVQQVGRTIHANVALCDDRYKLANKPFTFEIE